MADAARTVLPVRHQPPLPRERMIVTDAPDAEAIEMDVVIVGAGPARRGWRAPSSCRA
jgi:hypothetical protein